MRLVKPTTKYQKSFLQAVKESHKEGRNKDIESKQSPKQFAEFVKKLRDQEKRVPKGYVLQSVFWLVDRNKFIGRVSVRHNLTKRLREEGGHIGYEIRPSERRKGYGKKILKLGLRKTLQLDIKKALVTCDDDNVGSQKIIEANGGILQDKIRKGEKLVRRYWIKIK